MASFVRQLNKYDFHKVRQTNDSGSASNGANVSASCSLKDSSLALTMRADARV